MRIVVDGSVRFDSDHEDRLNKLGKFKYYKPNCTKKTFFDSVKDAEVIIINKTFFNEYIPKLKSKLVSVWSTGYDVIDINKCKKNKITVTNVPGYSTDSTAEHVFMFIFEFTKKLAWQEEELKKGKWNHQLNPLTEIRNKTIGIIGYGNIGKKVAKIAIGLGMEVLVYTRSTVNDIKIQQVSLVELLQFSDFITIHCPLNEETKNLISINELNIMQSNAYLINCARGAIVNEKDLITALKKKSIAGAGIDVFSKEPLPKTSEFRKLENVVLTPHTAFYTKEALKRLGNVAIDNIENFFDKKPSNVVD